MASYRIASLVPSFTETLFELGLEQHIVARTGYCIHPKAAHTVPKVGGTKTVNLSKLARLRPTHVLVNPDENTLDTIAALAKFDPAPHIITLHPICLQDNFRVFSTLGLHFQVADRAQQLCTQLQSQIQHLQHSPVKPLKVLYLIWQDPWMTVAQNTYISNTLAMFGLHTQPPTMAAEFGASRYPCIDDLARCVKDYGLDAILLSSEPYLFTPTHRDELQQQLGIPVHLVDGEMCSWYGSRSIHAIPFLQQWVIQHFDKANCV